MNANIVLATFNHVKNISALKKIYIFRFADIVFHGHSYGSVSVIEQLNEYDKLRILILQHNFNMFKNLFHS